MPLDDRARSFLQMLHRIDAPRLSELPIDVARRNYAKMLYLYRTEPCAEVLVQDCHIARREHEGGPLSARLYRPMRAGDAALPVLLWLHGGGWTLGDLAGYDPLCRAIANASGIAVFTLDYRLAPENRFPAALDDAWQTLCWLQRHGGGYGLDTAKLAVGGDSAGGNLAAVLALLARDAGMVLAQQLLIYPVVNLASDWKADAPYQAGHFLDAEGMRWFMYNYLDTEADRLDWRASPALAKSHVGLAPALILSAECDPLTPGVAAYAQQMRAAGVPVRYHDYAGAIHGFLTFPRIFLAADDAVSLIGRCLREDFGLEEVK
ncbi:alpha/beta hydrolase [Uliginosibacterium gangwonense]|uniref:alpha/beta hydrolase n=1 Tax=Uliginosibacterium gangwonense TaxID=392736 RepID=UPI0003712015|nr:alpha/beta hydrolase [Uliginosibacterium gangwonense]